MTTELMESYSKIFDNNDGTNSIVDASQSILESSHTNSDFSKKTKNNDSLEVFLADNIACNESVYMSLEISNESNTMSNDKVVGPDTNNENDISDDCRNLFTRLMDEVEENNKKITYVMDINKSLKEEVETKNNIK